MSVLSYFFESIRAKPQRPTNVRKLGDSEMKVELVHNKTRRLHIGCVIFWTPSSINLIKYLGFYCNPVGNASSEIRQYVHVSHV